MIVALRVWCPPNGVFLTMDSLYIAPFSTLLLTDLDGPFSGRWEIDIQPSPSGSNIRITEVGKVTNPFFRFVSRFIIGHTTFMEKYLKGPASRFGENAELSERKFIDTGSVVSYLLINKPAESNFSFISLGFCGCELVVSSRAGSCGLELNPALSHLQSTGASIVWPSGYSDGTRRHAMKILLLLPLLLVFSVSGQNSATSDDGSQVVVLSFKWERTRQKPAKLESTGNAPVPAMIPANKNFQRNVRINDPKGVRDPNLDTIDGRSAALEKIVQESRTPNAKAVDAFSYQIRIQNTSTKAIDILFWEYQFTESSSPTEVTRRQFLCGVEIKPGKNKDVKALSFSGPGDVITVSGLANKSRDLYQEKVLINRIEYKDGSIWQRKGWKLAEVKAGYERALATPWAAEMCRGL